MKPLTLEELEQDGWEADADFKNKIAEREAQIELNSAVVSISESVGEIAKASSPDPVDIKPITESMKQIITELKKMADIKGWEKIGLKFIRDKDKLISTAILERIK